LYSDHFYKEKQMRASHILVSTKEQADAILAEASALNFGSLAQQHSSCPSKARGGDLGEFGPGQMVQPFEQATLATAVGSISQPVQTQFGYHLIHRTG
jgi:peptidyl-prolyl cis-trans isomerase C